MNRWVRIALADNQTAWKCNECRLYAAYDPQGERCPNCRKIAELEQANKILKGEIIDLRILHFDPDSNVKDQEG